MLRIVRAIEEFMGYVPLTKKLSYELRNGIEAIPIRLLKTDS